MKKFWIITHGGTIVSDNFGIPSLSDIAFCLSNINRYNGSSEKKISVAAHSLLVYQLVKDRGFGVIFQLLALLHDAGESVIGDIPSPLKTSYFDQMEKDIINRVMYSVGISITESDWEPIRIIDKEILSLEVHEGEFGPKELQYFIPKLPPFERTKSFSRLFFDVCNMNYDEEYYEALFHKTALDLVTQYHELV